MHEPKILLDTNIFIYLLDARSEILKSRIEARHRGELVTSAIVRAEVMMGAAARNQVESAEMLFRQIDAMPFDAKAAEIYASLPFHRGNLDRFIGAHALALDLTLVTNNVSDFDEISNLRIENWTT